jgi:predicted TIM-barrel fold metal-dependent hydrolase
MTDTAAMSAPPLIVEPPLIDCHAHIWGAEMPYVSTAWTRPDYVYAAEDFLADLDAQGILFGVIAAASLFGTYNDYVIRALRASKRLRGTANVDVETDLYTLEALRADGITGIRLQWFFMDELPDMGEDAFQLLCVRLRDLGMHIHLNIEGHRLYEVASRVMDTGVNLVIDHFGWHDPAPGLAAQSYQDMQRLLDRGHAWVKLSCGHVRTDPDLPKAYARDLLTRYGTDRLLWGSNAPFVGHEGKLSYAQAVAEFRDIVPDAAARRAIGETGYRFYFED